MTRWVVVGGGSAGSVIAARLSERSGHDVLLLEAGSGATPGISPAGAPILDVPAILRNAQVARRAGAAPEPYVQGAGIGGSSLVNAAVAIGRQDTLALGHELPLERPAVVGDVASAVEHIDEGAARVNLLARHGERVTARDAYIAPAVDRPNFSVRSDVEVSRVEFVGRRAVGVATASGEFVDADRVVLCAGAIESPSILLRSGADTPGIGQGLTDHVGVSIAFDRTAPAIPDTPAIGTTIERPGRQIMVIDYLPDDRSMGALLCGLLDVASVGSVTLPDRGGPAVVLLNQLATCSDRAGLDLAVRDGADLARRLRSEGVVGECYLDEHGTTLDRHAPLVHRLGGYHHLAASCRTGVALGADGALHGYRDLYVCDASALPRLPQRNLYLNVIRHAERTVRRWLANS